MMLYELIWLESLRPSVPVGPDQVGSLLGNHDSGGVCVAGDNAWHYGCVDHSKAGNPVHPAGRVETRVRVIERG